MGEPNVLTKLWWHGVEITASVLGGIVLASVTSLGKWVRNDIFKMDEKRWRREEQIRADEREVIAKNTAKAEHNAYVDRLEREREELVTRSERLTPDDGETIRNFVKELLRWIRSNGLWDTLGNEPIAVSIEGRLRPWGI